VKPWDRMEITGFGSRRSRKPLDRPCSETTEVEFRKLGNRSAEKDLCAHPAEQGGALCSSMEMFAFVERVIAS
jgi:hypothetical protein